MSDVKRCGLVTFEGLTQYLHVCLPESAACQCGKIVYPPRARLHRPTPKERGE